MFVIVWFRSNPMLVVAICLSVGTVARVISKWTKADYPKVSAFFYTVAGIFTDLVQVTEGLLRTFGLLPPDPPAPPGTPYRSAMPASSDDDPPPPVAQRRRTLWFLPPAMRVAALAAAVVGCQFFGQAKNAQDVSNVGVCVLEHITEPPAQIVSECAGATLQVVEDLITAQKHAEAKRHPGGCP